MADVLLEIGLEEVPAGFMPNALRHLQERAEAELKENRLAYGQVKVFGTPRRLTLLINQIAEEQDALHEEVRGPSQKVAYDGEGNPGKALLGFMRSQGVASDQLITKTVKGTDYVFAQKHTPGKPVAEVLQTLLPTLILNLPFPKYMRWGSYDTKYVRPIHWVVALIDDAVIPFALEMCRSGRKTRGHRFLGAQSIEIQSAATYREQLSSAWVMVDQEERKARIVEEMHALAADENAYVQADDALLEEIVYLVEYPTALMGYFNADFLNMPPELVITPMKEHQRYFPIFSTDDDRLINRFITVRNGNAEHIDTVRKGNESVLTARLSDALFFYREDLKIDPASQIDRLKQIVFQERLGTIYDKCRRLEKNANAIGVLINAKTDAVDAAQIAAMLCKTDLVSHVVTEFPELQGIMGERYLLAQENYSVETAQAVREHYMPRFAGDDVPSSQAGLILSLADKMDTIVGCFAAGIEPTGSQDPYALRRQASGVVTMIIAHRLQVSLRALIDTAMTALQTAIDFDAAALREKVYAFFEQRMRTTLQEAGYPVTFTRAILAVGYDNPLETLHRAEQCDQWMRTDAAAFDAMAMSYKRANNLVKKSEPRDVDPTLFDAPEEQVLFDRIQETAIRMQADKGQGDYASALRTFLSLNDAIENFFDHVMVMVDDEAKKHNRLGLLRLYTDLVNDMIKIDLL